MAKSLPNDLMSQLSAAEKKAGLPEGTMFAVLQQETGGNAKYWEDPAAYHYGLNAEGKRIAGHTGKVSTAFGPFGILESTARDPGFGVAPLKDKSFGEQARFASEYLAARSKKGGLEAGLAGYGEGAKYGQQVAARIQGKKPTTTPMVVDDSHVIPMTVGDAPEWAAAAPIRLEPSKPYKITPLEEWEALKQVMPEAAPVATLQTYGQEASPSYASLLGSLASLAQPDFAPVKPMKPGV